MMMKLEDEDEAVRHAAVATLGQVAASIGKGPIIARATHPRMGVREAAVLLLGKLEPKDLADRIGVVVDRIADVEVRACEPSPLPTLEPVHARAHHGATPSLSLPRCACAPQPSKHFNHSSRSSL
jgi:HEAT repeat protein